MNEDTIGVCPIDTSFAVQYGQTAIIGMGLLVGLLAIMLYRIWTSDRKYKVQS